ncbi:MAG: SurA N-terminal domain-containing protein [Halobacteriovoraceae bacterium]|nr:SurA N-terminal domain-containing protein [Halobacteriovoraceae bacterium]
MSNTFQKKTSAIIVQIFIGLIIVGFMFTGYQTGFGPTVNNVASVGKYQISGREFNSEINRRIQFYTQMSGGKSLSSVQIKKFGIRESALESLISKKLFLVLSDDMGISPGSEQIKEEIKNLPYFKTNDQFDINLYKNLLNANQFSTQEFENTMKEDLSVKLVKEMLDNVPISKGYETTISKLKNTVIPIDAVSINLNSLETYIEVTPKEIEEFLKDETNINRAKSIFNERKSQKYDQAEEVLASHILLKKDKESDSEFEKKVQDLLKKLNTKNFAELANKNTQDPSGKKNGGDLNWFPRGRMVPEFDKVAFSTPKGQISSPVKTQFGTHIIYVRNKKDKKDAKFEDYRAEISKELIQKKKTNEKNTLAEKIFSDVKTNIKNEKNLSTIIAKYKLTHVSNNEINAIDGLKGKINLEDQKLDQIFNSPNQVLEFKDINQYLVISTGSQKTVENKGDKTSESFALARKLQDKIMKTLKENTSIKTTRGLLD